MMRPSIRARLPIVVFALLLGAFPGLAQAQFTFPSPPHLDIKDLDPTNKNSELRKSLAHADDVVHEQVVSAQGGRFNVTLRNPGNIVLQYNFNGAPQPPLGARMQRTHKGIGDATVRFDQGLGDESFLEYNLKSGKAYYFRWNRTNLPEGGTANLLNLYGEPPASPHPPHQTIHVRFRNTTGVPVAFHLGGQGGTSGTLPAGRVAQYTVPVDPGVTPMISLRQADGSARPFSLADKGRYAFVDNDGAIINAFDQ